MKRIMEKLETLLEWGGLKKEIILLVISGISLLLSLFHIPLPFSIAWVAIILCGVPIILEAIIGLVTAFDIKADVLVSLALVASICIGKHFAAGEIAFIMQLGALLEDLTVAKARAGIEKLVHLTPQTARVLRNDTEKIIPAEQVQVQDLLRVLPGETIPVDGVITDGQTSINQVVMTGESLPVDKTVGDAVSSGTVNQFGAFEIRATKVGADSSIQRMIQLVQSADAGKAKIVGLADRWATWIADRCGTYMVTEWADYSSRYHLGCILSVCLGTGNPNRNYGNATKHGFLVREGDALERLEGVTKIMFDKTGTLTYGTPKVIAQKSLLPEWSDTELYTLCAAVEQFPEHPLGKAIVQSYQQMHGAISQKAEQFQMWMGRGVSAQVSGVSVLAGNQKLLEEQQIFIPEAAQADIQAALQKGCTVIHIVADGKFAGYLVL